MTKTEKTSELIEQSLLYERMWSEMATILGHLSEKKNQNAREAKELGEKPDKMFDALIEILSGIKNELREKTDSLWSEVDETAEKFDSGYENLANAMLEMAALDYETALCGEGNATEKRLIEMFAREDAEMYTGLDFSKVLLAIRKAHPKFVQVVREHGGEIMAETKRVRNTRSANMRNAKIKCPLCGCGLYAWGKPVHGWQTIRCTGCNLTERYKVKPNEA